MVVVALDWWEVLLTGVILVASGLGLYERGSRKGAEQAAKPREPRIYDL